MGIQEGTYRLLPSSLAMWTRAGSVRLSMLTTLTGHPRRAEREFRAPDPGFAGAYTPLGAKMSEQNQYQYDVFVSYAEAEQTGCGTSCCRGWRGKDFKIITTEALTRVPIESRK